MTLRWSALLVLAAFAAAFAYQVVSRLSTEALNLGLGVACGMAASVPAFLGLAIALTRERRDRDDDDEPMVEPQNRSERPRAPQAPHVIIIAPPNGALGPGQSYQLPMANPYQTGWPSPDDDVVEGRDWRIVGEEPD